MSTTLAHGPEPSYCVGRILPGKPLSPSQWATCWKYGWDESTTVASRIGYDFGHNVTARVDRSHGHRPRGPRPREEYSGT